MTDGNFMLDKSQLWIEYLALQKENMRLKKIIKEFNNLKSFPGTDSAHQVALDIINSQKINNQSEINNKIIDTVFITNDINQSSPTVDKIQLFMSLFRGRNDVYAQRWQNKSDQSGYSPVCDNLWIPGLCYKPKIKCARCQNKKYAPLTESVIDNHLRGTTVVGIYPMSQGETCFFLAIDFDKEGWKEDISEVTMTCTQFDIPYTVERSRSGNGGHLWFFFTDEIPAPLARQFGTLLLTYSMDKRHEISFKSYDRLFPNQDTMPKGGLGNLIALPLQMQVRYNGNSIFIDKNFKPYPDQWTFLNGIKKLTEKELQGFISELASKHGNDLGDLKNSETDKNKPWIKKSFTLQQQDFPKSIEIVRASMLYVEKAGLSQKALNTLKRFAAFQNPEFYKKQAMRLPTYNLPRVISCSENHENYLGLPRGSEDAVIELLESNKVKLNQIDFTQSGRLIDVEFNGELRADQQLAAQAMMKHDTGVLSATTAFGKTVIGAKLISQRKVNTLIIVHRQQLLNQWKKRLSEFLLVHETLPEMSSKRGRKKQSDVIGQLGAGKNCLTSIVDIAIMQSLNTRGKVKSCVENYGMVIIDECHHVPSVSFEQIMKNVTAKYIYGLTATPSRQDGHHPIIFFYCGPIRYRVDAKEQAQKRPFEHFMIPRFTPFKTGFHKAADELTIQEIYSALIADEIRNQHIIDDVVQCYNKGRNCLVLTGRVAHVHTLCEMLERVIPEVIVLVGGMGRKKTLEVTAQIATVPADKALVLISTGSFIGEGFDEPRLDTLFLAMPIAWKGTLQQYAGRLHRLYENKKDVQIYDYVDIHVGMLEKMYGKRQKGYASIGYKVKVENLVNSPTEIIFDKSSFYPVYINDIKTASNQVIIVSPFLTQKRINQIMPDFQCIMEKQVNIIIVTRPVEDFEPRKQAVLELIHRALSGAGINVLFKSKIHQKYAIIDHKLVWYGSINLLSFGYSEESIMRLASSNIAYELLKSIRV